MTTLWSSRHVLKAGCNAMANSVRSSPSCIFRSMVKVRVLSLHFSTLRAGNCFGRIRALSTFPFFSPKCSEDVVRADFVVGSKLSFVVKRRMGTIAPEEVEGDGEVRLLRLLERLKNYEKEGVPKGAGTDSIAGFDLERMERLLVRLGNPLSSYPVVHVAGTKGKGSTVSFISSMLRAAGLSVGTYTSPHVTSIRERITAGKSGNSISSNALSKLVADLQATVDEAVAEESGLLTHFEVLTALAFAHFSREKVNVAVVETGLGGARDATNVISAEGLASAVIVGIGCEHLAALGGSLESIALAKAGIIKENRPVVVGLQMHPEVNEILQKVAAVKGSPLIPALKSMVRDGGGISSTVSGQPVQFCDILIPNPPGPGFEASNEEWKMENVKLRALGAHQQDNAITAISTILALRAQGWHIPDSAIRVGLETTEMPGRFQVVGSENSKALGCLSARLILDGAHTGESGVALGKTLRDCFPAARLAFVVAMASDKDKQAFARALLREANPDVVVTTRVPVAGGYGRSFTAQELAECWSQIAQALKYTAKRSGHVDEEELLVTSVEPMQAAIKEAAALLERRQEGGEEPPVICVSGSLHAVAAALSLFQTKMHVEC